MKIQRPFIFKQKKEITDSDLFYRSLFENNVEIVFFADAHGTIAKVNDGFMKSWI